MRPTVVTLMGPTAVGKTQAALDIADRANVDIVSVDSAMVYRRMDIGTAKPARPVLARYPHALVDIAEPSDPYSAARFRANADAAIRAAFAAGRTPLLVGGTMLYFRVFAHGIDALPAADPALRERLAARAAREGWPALHRELAQRDPDAARRIDPANGARIARALEVIELTGRPITAQWTNAAASAAERLGCRLAEFAILPAERARHHERIAERLGAMLRAGLVEEVRALREDAALHEDLPAMRAVGYRQVWQHLDGRFDHAEMVARIAAATRQAAKRQTTWLRQWPASRVASASDAAQRIVALLNH